MDEPGTGKLSVNSIKTGEVKLPAPELRITAASLLRSRRAFDPVVADPLFDELSQLLASDPVRAAPRVVELAMRSCDAGSAGLSLIRLNSAGHADFEWQAVAGAMARYQGDGTPRAFSPCGRCLSAGTPLLLSRPETEFTYLARLQPSIFAALYVPVYQADGQPLGALWVVHHDPVSRFSEDDVRRMELLAPRRMLSPRGRPV